MMWKLFFVAFLAVGVTCEEPPTTQPPLASTQPTPAPTPFDWGRDKWAYCSFAQERTMEAKRKDVKTCFGEVLFSVKDSKCKTIEDIKSLTDKFINQSSCLYNYTDASKTNTAKGKLEKNVGEILKMMNETIKNYKDVAKNATQCIKNAKSQILTDCASKTRGTHQLLVDRFSENDNFSMIELVRTLDFNSTSGRDDGKKINDCVGESFKNKAECTNMHNFTVALFQLAKATNYNSGTIVAINSLVLIATTLLALLFK